MALLRFLRSAALGSLSVLLYGYVDLVAPQWSFTAFLGCPHGSAGAGGRFRKALQRENATALSHVVSLVGRCAVHPTGAHVPGRRCGRSFGVSARGNAAYLAITQGAKEVGRDPQDEEMWDNSPEARVRRILLEHAPHKLPKLPRILEKYGGDWDEMLSAAEAKYVYGTVCSRDLRDLPEEQPGRGAC
eukprot:scaffold608_cov248-Pinguiococcus_pyrenoidosus.AAC.7